MEYTVRTEGKEEFVNITHMVEEAVWTSGVENGIVTVFVPHTTAGITINENADPDVVKDILYSLGKIVPEDQNFAHLEGNSTGHIKASLMGSSVSLIVEDNHLKTGTWQGIYLCEFDGPRTRKVYVKVQ